MSTHQLPIFSSRCGCSFLTNLRSLPGSRVLMTAIVLCGIAGTALADPPNPSLPFRSDVVSNALLSRNVRAAIDADPELRGVNLVVSVVDGIAVIGGPVSSSAVAKRVESVVRKIPEIKDVKNGCFVIAGPDPLMAALAEKMGTTAPARPTSAVLPGVLTGQQPPVSLPPLPIAENSALVAAAPGSNTVVVRKPVPPAGGGLGVLGAPVSPNASGSAPTPVSSADSSTVQVTVPGRLTSSGTPTIATLNDILTSAGNVKKVEARFANLTVELSNGILLIGGTAPKASDAWELAEKLRQIPGVSRVVVGAMPGK